MLRALGNIVLIFLLFITIFTLKDTLTPVAERIGSEVQTVVASLEKKYGIKTPLHQLEQQPVPEMSTPGPLTVVEPHPTVPTTPETSSTTSTSALTRANIVYWTNKARKENGNLPALKEVSLLDTTATAKTNDMFAYSYFEHTSPSGRTVADQAQEAGYEYITIGENLALGHFATAAEVVDAWMNSPGHRANILNSRYTEIGIGVRKGAYKGDTVWILTQHFGLPRSACPKIDTGLHELITANQSKLDSMFATLGVKKEEIAATGQFSPSYNTLVNQYNELVRQYNALVTDTKTEIATYNTQVQEYNLCLQAK